MESRDPFAAVREVLMRARAEHAFPAAVVEVGNATRALWREAVGTLTFDNASPPTREDTIFDLASLTKVIATTPLVMRDVERGAIALDDPVSRYIEEWTAADRQQVTVRDLLSHSSGLPGHRPFYLDIQGRAAIEAAICSTPLEYAPGSKSIYSDLGFMLLGFLLERGATLAERFDALRAQMGPIHDLQFHPPEIWKKRTAPTEIDPWRGRLIVGEVHDENAAALGGAAGHAGLFGTAAAVGEYARHVLQVLGGRVGAFRTDTLNEFIARRRSVPGSSRALGWDTMLPTSSCGTKMSPRAFGHTGFTGTSLWIDPDPGVYVVLLTNRVHPTRNNSAITPVRRAVHDAVIDAIDAR
jgi:CubicO group peptidase (beta-lactamase class C family)